MGGLIGTVTGGLDHLAGSTDESVDRTFDDEGGGGMFAGIADTGDAVAGPTDEAVGFLGRGVGGLTSLVDSQPGNTAGPGQQESTLTDPVTNTFDDTQGGGLVEGADQTLGNLDESVSRQFDTTPGGGVFDLDTVVGGLLDNPVALAAAGLGTAYILGQLFDVQAGGPA